MIVASSKQGLQFGRERCLCFTFLSRPQKEKKSFQNKKMSFFDENRAEAARDIPELKIESKTETLQLPKENLSLNSKPKMSKKLLFNPTFTSSIDHKKILQRQNEISEKKQLNPKEENHDLELENCIEPNSLDTQPNLLKFLKHLTYAT